VCGDSDTSSTDGLGIDYITESDEIDESSCMDEDKIRVFDGEETGLCGEVGYWKDSGWDSQMVNTCEVIRGEAVVEKRHDREEESHGHRRIEKEVDRPGVPEEYNRRQMEGGTDLIFSGEETAEPAVFGHILAFPTQHRPISHRRERMVSSTGVQSQNDEISHPIRSAVNKQHIGRLVLPGSNPRAIDWGGVWHWKRSKRQNSCYTLGRICLCVS